MALVDRIREGLRNLFKGVDASKSLQVVNEQDADEDCDTSYNHFGEEEDFSASPDEMVSFDDFETISFTSKEKKEEERRRIAEKLRKIADEERGIAEEYCRKEEKRRLIAAKLRKVAEEECRRTECERQRKKEAELHRVEEERCRIKEEGRRVFIPNTIAGLMALLVRADGRVVKKELKHTENYLKGHVKFWKYTWRKLNHCLKLKDVQMLFEKSCKDADAYMFYYEKLALIEQLVDIARFDNDIRPSEWEVLNVVMEGLGLEKGDISYFSRKYQALRICGAGNGSKTVLSPYNVLGIETDASAEDICSALVELMDKYNPDVAIDCNLIQTLEEKLKEIVSAFEALLQDNKLPGARTTLPSTLTE